MGINPGKVLFTSAAGEEFVRKIELPEMPDEELKRGIKLGSRRIFKYGP